MSKNISNPLFYGQNFTEMKIPGSKNWFTGTKNRKKPIFDLIFKIIFRKNSLTNLLKDPWGPLGVA